MRSTAQRPASAETAMAAALNGRGFGGKAIPSPHASLPPAAIAPNFAADDVLVGKAEAGDPIALNLAKLIEGRLLIQGVSGAGKSWTLRRLLEQSNGLVQQIVVDPDGEFRELGEHLGLLRLEGHRLDIATLAIAGARAREHQASVLLDLSELDRDGQMQAVAAFFDALMSVGREHWHPCLVAVDEAHLFAPHGGFTESTATRKASIAAVTDLMSRGRKRGLAGVLATQRLVRLSKSVVSEVMNFMIGINTLDLDVRRAADSIGWDARKAFDRLPMLEPGEFVVVGPAFSRSPTVLRVAGVVTGHRGAAPRLGQVRVLAPDAAARLLDLDALLAHSGVPDDALPEPPALRHVRGFIREPAFPDAGRVWGELARLAPQGARITALAQHFNRSVEQVSGALDLLDRFGTVEFIGNGDERAVRAVKGMTT